MLLAAAVWRIQMIREERPQHSGGKKMNPMLITKCRCFETKRLMILRGKMRQSLKEAPYSEGMFIRLRQFPGRIQQ